MSGSLRVLQKELNPATKHDHVDFVLDCGLIIRYNDPRRFGAILWTDAAVCQYPLLIKLGIEPLDSLFTGNYLKLKLKHRHKAIKQLIMDNSIVVGIGNIYATESLFLAQINPTINGSILNAAQCTNLVTVIKQVLKLAIIHGGTTVKDFVNSAGKPGYFTQYLQVYGRAGLACVKCNTQLSSMMLGQRKTVFCINCQPFA